jgi:hypothetical protein
MIKTKPFRQERRWPNHDYSRFFGRCGHGECGECGPVIDTFGIHRFPGPYLFRRSFPGGAGGFRLGGFSHAPSSAAFASSSFEAGVKTPAATRVSPAQSNTGGSRRPAAGSHRKTASLPGLIWNASFMCPIILASTRIGRFNKLLKHVFSPAKMLSKQDFNYSVDFSCGFLIEHVYLKVILSD